MIEKINLLVSQQRKAGIFPCANWAFMDKDKKSTFLEGYAQITPEKEVLKPDMLFDLASITKVVCTGSVVLKLWEEGKLDIDVPFSTYYPSFQDNRVSLRHLLTHTSDINPFIKDRDILNDEELKEAFNYLTVGENLGKSCQYTDTGTVLMGFMLEKIYQKDAQDIFQELVLNPLGLHNSKFQPIVPASLAVPTEVTENRGLIRGQTHDPKAFVLGKHAGSAGLFSTLADMMRYIEEVFFKQTFLKPETIEALLQDFSPLKNQNRSLGWDMKFDKAGNPFLFHSGFTGTFLLLDPRRKKAFVFLSNRVHPHNFREEYLKNRDIIINKYLQLVSD